MPDAGYASSLLGHEVVVTLDRPDGEKPATVAKGTLLAWADSGEVVVRDEMGFVHYCWPMLDIAPAHIDGSGATS